jgi:hypothetical protein
VRKFLSKATSRYQLLLVLTGTVVFVLHFYLLSYPRLATGAESIGLSIIITTLVTTAVNLSFEQGLYSSFEIIRGSTAAETTNIYPTRREAIRAIEEKVGRTLKTIDVLAIAGTDFFGLNCAVINELDERCRLKANVCVRILLLDPRSYFAVERCLLEERSKPENLDSAAFGYPDRKLCQDILLSLRQLERILDELKKVPQTDFHLDVRTYNEAPQFMCVRLDGEIFVEPYHKGTTASQNRSLLASCLGKTVPVLRTTTGSNLGQVLHSHFELVWERSQNRSLQPGCTGILEVELRQKDWVKRFQERDRDTEEALEIRAKVDPRSGKPPQPTRGVPKAEPGTPSTAS